MSDPIVRNMPSPLYLVTWKAGYPEQYLGRVYDNKNVALRVCEPDQMVIELRLEQPKVEACKCPPFTCADEMGSCRLPELAGCRKRNPQ